MRGPTKQRIVDMQSGDALRAELAAARHEVAQLRTCLLAIAKERGRLIISKRHLDAIDDADSVDVTVLENGDTRVDYVRAQT
jgi:hypothetical protein